MNIYASVYEPDAAEAFSTLKPITLDEEWEMVESVLKDIQKNILEGTLEDMEQEGYEIPTEE